MSAKSNITLIAISAILGAAIGAGISYAVTQPILTSLQSTVNSMEASHTGLEARVDALNSSGLNLAQRVNSMSITQADLEGEIDELNSIQLDTKEDISAINNNLAEHLNQTWHLTLFTPTLSSSDGLIKTKTFEANGPLRLLWSFKADLPGCWLIIETHYANNNTLAATRMVSGLYDMDTSDLELNLDQYYLVLKPSINVVEYYVKVFAWY